MSKNRIYNLLVKNLFTTGRSNRKEYIIRSSVTIFLCIIHDLYNRSDKSDLLYIDHFLFDTIHLILVLICIVYVIQMVFLNIRRLHDFNVSGWWQLLIPFIPFILCIITWPGGVATAQFFILAEPLFCLLPYILFIPLSIMKGTPGPNKYGEPPVD